MSSFLILCVSLAAFFGSRSGRESDNSPRGTISFNRGNLVYKPPIPPKRKDDKNDSSL